ncbi:MAG: pre-peptidase C-terminal domain-containing protein, partial [Planctomycetota bacterium]
MMKPQSSHVARLLALALVILGTASIAPAAEITVDDVRIAAGAREGRATATPWSGVWWPFSDCELGKGWNGTGADFSYDSVAKVWSRLTPNKAMNDVSPFLKYDEYVRKVTGTDPKSALYELTGDRPSGFMHNVYGEEKERYDREGIGYGWWGHCNGWCAAALMEKEPIAPIEAQGVRFEVADLKGLLTETHWAIQSDFTGRRYNLPKPYMTESRQPGKDLLAKLVAGTPAPVASYVKWYEKAYVKTLPASTVATLKPTDFKATLESFEKSFVENYDNAYADVKPEVFHKILETVIGRKKLAFVCDITANEEVWNHPAFAYSMNITKVRDFTEAGAARVEWNVETTVWYATDGVSESIIGVSEFTEDYTYTLVTDATGKILSGKWTGSSVDDHPDFCWLPTYNPTGPDSGENKKVEYGKVITLLPAHHMQAQTRGVDLTANGIKASTRRPNDRTTTWSNPINATGEVTFTIASTTSLSIAKVAYFHEPVNATWGDDVTASRSALVALGTSTAGPTFQAKAQLQGTGKKMVVAYAYDAAGKLVAIDELTLNYGSTGPNNNGTDDALEPNNTRAQAIAVQPGATPNLQCKDDDWFKVVLTASSDLSIKAAFANAEGDLDMTLEGPSGQVAKSETTSDEEVCAGKGLAAGTYYVHVYGYEGARAKYALTVTITPAGTTNPTDDQYEQNDDRANAKALAAGVYPSLKCQDDDWFKVTVSATGKLEAKIDFRHVEGDLDLVMTDANGTVLKKSESTSDKETVTATGLAAGTYYVRVFGYNGAKA